MREHGKLGNRAKFEELWKSTTEAFESLPWHGSSLYDRAHNAQPG
jgi:hypothetical protein